MNRTAVVATAVILLNLLVATAHGWTHSEAHVPLEPWQRTFVQIAVYALPVLAAVLYWTPFRRAAAVLLTGSMLAALAFGVVYHFVADTVDHVAHRSPGESLFVVTAVLLVPAEALGAAVARGPGVG